MKIDPIKKNQSNFELKIRTKNLLVGKINTRINLYSIC